MQPISNNALYMTGLRKYFGAILLLLGVVCLVLYKYVAPENGLLIVSMILELAGIIIYIRINRKG